jgi:hypothetical protein
MPAVNVKRGVGRTAAASSVHGEDGRPSLEHDEDVPRRTGWCNEYLMGRWTRPELLPIVRLIGRAPRPLLRADAADYETDIGNPCRLHLVATSIDCDEIPVSVVAGRHRYQPRPASDFNLERHPRNASRRAA